MKCARRERQRERNIFISSVRRLAQRIFTLLSRSVFPASPHLRFFTLCSFPRFTDCVMIRGSGFTRGKYRSILRWSIKDRAKIDIGFFSRRICRSQPTRPFQFHFSLRFFFPLFFFHVRSHPNNRESPWARYREMDRGAGCVRRESRWER